MTCHVFCLCCCVCVSCGDIVVTDVVDIEENIWSPRFVLLYSSSNKSGLDHLDYRRDLITENLFREIKDPKHPLRYLLLPVKVYRSQMFLRLTYPYQLPLSKAME